MSENRGNYGPLLIGGALIFVLGVLALNRNQFVNPLPLTPVPIVPGLPQIVSDLEGIKAGIEAQATSAKQFLNDQRRPRRNNNAAQLNAGRVKYQVVQTDMAQLAGYLEAAINRRFQDGDIAKVEKLRDDLNASTRDFKKWQNELYPPSPTYGAGSPLADIGNLYLEYIKMVNEQDAEARRVLSEHLRRCRLDSWESR